MPRHRVGAHGTRDGQFLIRVTSHHIAAPATAARRLQSLACLFRDSNLRPAHRGREVHRQHLTDDEPIGERLALALQRMINNVAPSDGSMRAPAPRVRRAARWTARGRR